LAEHEYSVVGHSRSKIGMWISFAAGLIAGGLVVGVGLLLALAEDRGLIDVPEIVFWPLTGAAVFGALFLLFDRSGWRWKGVRTVVGIPDISGSWDLEGKSYDQDNEPQWDWEGKIEITQRYERIFVWLKTAQSQSHSVSAAILPEGRAGFRLIYSYRNQPKPGDAELQAHIGHCDLLFAPDLQVAEGSYFNGGGRFTHGTMNLKRRAPDAA